MATESIEIRVKGQGFDLTLTPTTDGIGVTVHGETLTDLAHFVVRRDQGCRLRTLFDVAMAESDLLAGAHLAPMQPGAMAPIGNRLYFTGDSPNVE